METTARQRPVSAERLAAFFNPRGVALVGATDRSRWSLNAFENLAAFSPELPVYCVHPRHERVHGQRAYPSLQAVDGPVDLAYVMVPTDQVLPVLTEAADIGVRHAVVLTAGFSEAGDEGRRLQERLIELSAERGLLVLGPNGNGFVNASARLAPYGLVVPRPLISGPVGTVLQSGGLASSVLSLARHRGIGLSLAVSMGNEALISATDVMRYLVEDPQTRVIATFLESIRDPAEFRSVAEAAADAGKPIVAMKTGRSEAGQHAAMAHTGGLVGDDAIVDSAFRQLGVIRVGSLEQLMTTAGHLAYHQPPRGRRLAVLSASGGACGIVADRASDEAFELPEFPPEALDRLTELLPAFSNPQNPLDLTGYVLVDGTLYYRGLQAVSPYLEGRYDLVLFGLAIPTDRPPNPELVYERYQGICESIGRCPVPVVPMGTAGHDLSPFALELLDHFGLHILNSAEHGMTALGQARRWREWRERRASAPPIPPARPLPLPADARGVWSEVRTRRLLAEHGVPVVPARLARSGEEAAAAGEALGWPVALKAASDQLPHKSDVGGVRLGVRTQADAERAYDEIVAAVGAAAPEAEIEGVLVSPMREGGTELLVSVTRDPLWGPVLTIATGGIWVELLADSVTRLLPVGRAGVAEMLDELRGARLLAGARGRPPANREALVDAIDAVASLAQGLGDNLTVLEINPLWVSGDTIEVLDALAIWA